jgi:uncharacterized protein
MSTQQEAKPQELDQWFLDLLRCPACEERLPVMLSADKTALICECGRHSFPIRDGIPILLAEEATVIDPNAHPSKTAGSGAA